MQPQRQAKEKPHGGGSWRPGDAARCATRPTGKSLLSGLVVALCGAGRGCICPNRADSQRQRPKAPRCELLGRQVFGCSL